MGTRVTRQEAIERLCKLTEVVLGHLNYDTASDCICGKGGFWDSPGYDEARDYRNDGVVLEFIETAVREEIARRTAVRHADAVEGMTE